ncbi:capsular biosynthesis protein [Pueribacillus theae]|uniref:Capsular biosynthesis protein n=1 Tax=Pueribacillus theae TaxID=2171751 RepID=A0A2U1JUF4_9BACI|nr:CapA family protein [Pueribacillus theae]PWA08782.1 capsular biosynthesis protein [Pueribacillus theae]
MTKNKKLLQFIPLLFIIFVSLGLAGCNFLKPESEEAPPSEVNEEESIEQEEEIKEPETIITKATVAAIGDVLIHGSIYRDAQKGGTFNFDKMLVDVKPYLESADITIANQESMIGGKEIGLSTYPQFNSPFEVGDALKRAGLDIVTIANNHTLDRGEKAVLNALDHWDSLNIPYVGAYRSAEDRNEIRTLNKNEITFSFLAYTYGTNGIPVPKDKPYLVNLIDKEQIKKDIEEAREKSDVIVVSLHFGMEYERMPNDGQKNLVQFVADEGAHLIIGHHPHVLQPVDYVKSEKGHEAFVIYSLGNFLAAQEAQHDQYRRTGGILQVDVGKIQTGDETTIRILSPSFLPTYIHFQNWKNYRVLPMYQITDKELSNAQKHYKETKEHMSQFVPDLHFIEQ